MSEDTLRSREAVETPRRLDTRETQERAVHWTNPSMLETPEPPEGFEYRWVRVQIFDEADNKNIMSRKRQGYEPVHVDELPADFFTVGMEHGKLEGVVQIGDLILMKVPANIKKERNDYFAQKAKNAQEIVDRHLQQQDTAVMPITTQRHTAIQKGSDLDFQDD